MKVKSAWKPAIWRFVRVAVAIILSGIVAKYAKSEWYLAFAPFLNGLSKYLRDKFGIDVYVV